MKFILWQKKTKQFNLNLYFHSHSQPKRMKSSASSQMSTEDANGLDNGAANDTAAVNSSFYNRPHHPCGTWHPGINFLLKLVFINELLF